MLLPSVILGTMFVLTPYYSTFEKYRWKEREGFLEGVAWEVDSLKIGMSLYVRGNSVFFFSFLYFMNFYKT